mmetsp:Transcript_14768/g.21704  ORF Transcript_14768/g.21704 Transcript_14768/m.21704 type:complete len:206 (-) Transcript_14768:1233-1850(-)
MTPVDRFGFGFLPADFLVFITAESDFFVCFDLLDRRPPSLSLIGFSDAGVSFASKAVSSSTDFVDSALGLTSMSTSVPNFITPASVLTFSADRLTSSCSVRAFEFNSGVTAAADFLTSTLASFPGFAPTSCSGLREDSPFSVSRSATQSASRTSPCFAEFSPSSGSDSTDPTFPSSRFLKDGGGPERSGSAVFESLARFLSWLSS